MKYCLQKAGFGKSFYWKIIPVSNAKAKKLKAEGTKIFDSRSDAERYIKEKK